MLQISHCLLYSCSSITSGAKIEKNTFIQNVQIYRHHRMQAPCQKRFASRDCPVPRLNVITICGIMVLWSPHMQEVLYLANTGNFYIWIVLPGREIYFLGLPENLFQMLYSTCHHGYFCMYAKASLSQGYFKKERCLSPLPMYIGVPHTLCIIASPLPLIYDKPKSLI